MNKDFILNQWVPALRSGQFKQGNGALRYDVDGETHYCCLGVACQLLINEGQLPDWINYPGRNRREGALGIALVEKEDGEYSIAEVEASYLPRKAREILGFDMSGGPLLEFGFNYHQTLAEANDSGSSFKEIADKLEKLALSDT